MLPRYYLLGGHIGDVSKVWAIILIVLSVGLAAAVRSLPLSLVFGIFALFGLYRLFQPAKPGLFVELEADHLVINALTRARVAYRDIESAGFRRFHLHGIGRTVANFFVAVNHAFGGNFPWEGEPDEVDSTTVILRFRKTLWLPLPIPPFVHPRKSWRLMFEDASAFLDDIRKRLPSEA